jgi:hypothetical protein
VCLPWYRLSIARKRTRVHLIATARPAVNVSGRVDTSLVCAVAADFLGTSMIRNLIATHLTPIVQQGGLVRLTSNAGRVIIALWDQEYTVYASAPRTRRDPDRDESECGEIVSGKALAAPVPSFCVGRHAERLASPQLLIERGRHFVGRPKYACYRNLGELNQKVELSIKATDCMGCLPEL